MASPPTEPEQELGPAIDIIETVVLGIGRFRYWILPFAVLGLAIGAAIALIEVNVYTSTAKLWVNLEGKSDLRAESNLRGAPRQSPGGRGGLTMADELEFLRSPKLFDYIVREIGPERLNEPYDPMRFDHAGTPAMTRWQHKAQDWWHNRGRRNKASQGGGIDIESEKGFAAAVAILGPIQLRGRPTGNILHVIYQARSPELAQDVVRAACIAVTLRHEDIFEGRFDEEWVEDQIQVNTLRERDASGELRKHQDDCGFLDLVADEKRLLEKRATIENNLELTELRLTQLTNTKEKLAIDIEKLPKTETVEVPEVMGVNPYYEVVKKQIDKLKLEKQELKHDRKGEYLAESEARKQLEIDSYEKELETVDRWVVKDGAHQEERPNKPYEEAKRELAKNDLEKSNALIAERDYRQRLAGIENQLSAIANCKPVHRSMKERIKDASRDLSMFKGTMRDHDLDKTLDQTNMKNIFALEEASYNPRKTGPKRAQTVIFGAVGGIVAGLLFAVLRQLLDSKLRYPKSVANCLGVPVLGVISEQKSWRRLGKRLQKEMARA